MRTVTARRSGSGNRDGGAMLARLRWRLRRLLLRLRPVAVGLICAFAGVLVYILWSGGVFDRVLTATSAALENTAVRRGMHVRTIRIEGRRRTDADDLSAAIQVRKGEPLMQVDIGAIRDRVEELGWVARARVSRNWPDTLFVTIEERKPFAIWQYREEHRLIDRAGTVISGESVDAYGNLPQVVGKGANVHAAEFLALLEVRPVLRARVRAANRVGDRRWNLIVDGGVTVLLPEGGEARALDELIALDSEHSLLARGVSMIDMRFTDRLIVRLEKGRERVSSKKKPATGKMAGDREA